MYNHILTKVLLLSIIYYAEGNLCKSIEGTWYNQFGSEVTISMLPNRTIVGHFTTAVRLFLYDSPVKVIIRGAAATREGDSVFAFSAVWNDGDLATTWTGQCFECDGKETLHTNWVLWSSSAEKDCRENRKISRIGEDNFVRAEIRDSSPHSNPTLYAAEVPKVPKRAGDRISAVPHCRLVGHWDSNLNLSISIKPDSSIFVNGYFEAFMPLIDQVVEARTVLHGLQKQGTFGITATFTKENVIVTLVGQCNQCPDGNRIIKASWMKRTHLKDCKFLYRATRHGEFILPHK